MAVANTQGAFALLLQGQLGAAADAFDRILRQTPQDALAHAGLGHCYLRLGREDEAWRCLTQACRLSDQIGQAFSDLAWLAVKRGEAAVAEHAMRRALALNPADANARFVAAQLLFQQERFEEAEAEFARAEQIKPNIIEARYNLGNQVFERGDFDAASRHYEAYTRRRPQDVQGWINFGLSLARAGELARARSALQKAVALAPALAKPIVLLALVLKDGGAADAEQIPVLRRAVELAPDALAMHLQLACCLFNEQDFAGAKQHLRCVRQLDPDNLTARWLQFQMPDAVVAPNEEARAAFLARWRTGITAFENLDWNDPANARQASEIATSATSFYLGYLGQPLVEEQQRNAAVLRKLAMAAGWTRNETAATPIGRKRRRIAVFASALSARSVSLVWSSTLLALDPDAFEYGVFCQSIAEDDVGRSWRERARQIVAGRRTVEAWIDALRAFQPDVLLFCDIGMNRIAQAVASVRHAPVQIATWAHPMTTGIATLDYFLSADAFEPDDTAGHYSETLVRLPRLGSYLDPPAAPALPREPDGASRAVRLLCTQSADKLHGGHDALFAQILSAAPTAQLDIICSKPAHVAAELAARLRGAFAKQGLDFDSRCRVHAGQPADAYARFLAAADVCLDSLDFSGCLTSLDALWHELPIVCLPGEMMRGRQTYGMLHLLGLNELIAGDLAEYVAISARLAQDAGWRQALSARIRARKNELYRDRSVVVALADFLRDVEPPAASGLLARAAGIGDN
jgi:predicted O-linked N-acetylglucosamine transferase (SPINDLY family)